MASVKLKTDQSLDDARQILLKTVENVANEPPTKEEVERVKTRILKNLELEMNDSQSVALDLSEYYSQGDWRLMFLMRDRIKAVTEADVLRVAKTYLKESNRTLATFIPTKSPDRADDPGHSRYHLHVEGLQRVRRGRRRRSLRSQPVQHRIAHRPQHPPRRHEDVAALAQNPRRHRRGLPHHPLRR